MDVFSSSVAIGQVFTTRPSESEFDDLMTMQPVEEEDAREEFAETSFVLQSTKLAEEVRPCFTGYLPSHALIFEDSVRSVASRLSRLEFDAANSETVSEISSRGFTLGALLEFVCILLDWKRARNEIAGLAEAMHCFAGTSPDSLDLSWFDPDVSQTVDITYRVLVPLSARRKISYSRIMTGGRKCYPQAMVSHSWENIFTHTVAACISHALGTRFFFHILPYLRTGITKSFDGVRLLMRGLSQEALSSIIWMCAFSINQHSIGCDRVGCPCGLPKNLEGSNSEIGSFDIMMQMLAQFWPDFSQIVALDKECKIETELKACVGVPVGFEVDWKTQCISKVQRSARLEGVKRQPLVGDYIREVDGVKDIVGMQQRLSQDDVNVKITLVRVLGVVSRVWVVAEIAEAQCRGIPQHVTSHFPLRRSGHQYMTRIRAADVLASEATEKIDKENILKRIDLLGGAAKYNAKVKEALLKYPFEFKSLFGISSCFLLVIVFTLRLSILSAEEDIVWQQDVQNVVTILGQFTIAHASYFCVARFYWIFPVLNDCRLPIAVRIQRHNEIQSYLEQMPWYGEGLWFKTGIFSYQAAKRYRALFCCVFLLVFLHFLLVAWSSIARCQAHDISNFRVPCEDVPMFASVLCSLAVIGAFSAMFVLLECQCSLAGKPVSICILCSLSFLSTSAAWGQKSLLVVILVQAIVIVLVSITLWHSVLLRYSDGNRFAAHAQNTLRI